MGSHMNEQVTQIEYIDVLTKTGERTGISKPRRDIHRDGDYHRAVHVWIFAESTQELLLQLRSERKSYWPGHWHVSSAGHISAGDSSLVTARRELHEELGIILPKDAFELLFVFLEECVLNDGKLFENEFIDVYLVTTIDPIPLEAFTLQESEVSAVKYIHFEDYRNLLAKEDPQYVVYDVNDQYGQLFEILSKRYNQSAETRAMILQNQLNRYACVSLGAELTGLSNADREALELLVQAAKIIELISSTQVWCSNPSLRDWLELHADESHLNKLKWMYYLVNKSPWSSLDENEALLTTADSAVKLLPEAMQSVFGWKGIEYRAAFPVSKPPGANFYPPDMDNMEFELWKKCLQEDKQKEATGFFSVIKRESERNLDESLPPVTPSITRDAHDLYIVPYSQEYKDFLTKASDLLHKAGDLTSSSSLKKLLHSKADAFLSNDYFHSDISGVELDSKLHVTIGPYETREDTLFGYKATFKAFIGVVDEEATAQVKLFSDNLQDLERNLPVDDVYKWGDVSVTAPPIRVVQLIYNAGGMKGLQTIVKERGGSMAVLKNVAEARFKHIVQPIAEACIVEEQRKYVDFEAFFSHTVCRELCHATQERQVWAQELEEAKADIVGLWALRFLVNKNILPNTLIKSMYVSFLAACICVKGEAMVLNNLYEKGAFIVEADGTSLCVEFEKVEGAVERLSREILTMQLQGRGLNPALHKLEMMTQIPLDIFPMFGQN